jgi:hypothetical protein
MLKSIERAESVVILFRFSQCTPAFFEREDFDPYSSGPVMSAAE